jgi:hypothetical protein
MYAHDRHHSHSHRHHNESLQSISATTITITAIIITTRTFIQDVLPFWMEKPIPTRPKAVREKIKISHSKTTYTLFLSVNSTNTMLK